ncbi:DMT family transporter [Aggregatilinea lenta]|uniref:DMT family transporter n=1 Tax=Aggregatilinea lenta TaxID=913108 RepID=UPI000E5BE002|nr:DMT family transporter [Aggregatilinea lenta]
MTLFLIVLFGLIGGVAVGIQSPISSQISQRLGGSLESVFIVHLSGTLIAGALLLLKGEAQFGNWRVLPWYAAIAGVFGVIVISAINFTIPRIGATASVTLVVAGQLIIGLIIDQFGWFETSVREIDVSRLLGVAVLLLGTWLVVRS